MTVTRLIAVALLPLLLHGPIKAQTLQEIVVTATRTDTALRESIAAVSVVDGTQVQLGQPQLGLDESLNRVPGLFLQNRFNFAQDLRISNRGFGARASFGIRGTRILVDGIPATLADGQGSVDAIDLGSIQRIEVLRGPASTLFGNAAGGVIAIESEVGADQPFIEVRSALGEFGYDKTQLKAAGNVNRLGYMASIAHIDVDGYRDFSQARNTLVNLKGRYVTSLAPDATQFDVSLSHTDQPEANDPGGIDLAQALAAPQSARDRNVQLRTGEDLDETRLGVRALRRSLFRDQDRFAVSLFYGERQFDGRIPTGDGAIVFDRQFIGGGLQYDVSAIWGGKQHDWIMGVDVEIQDDERERFQNVNGLRGAALLAQREKVESTGVFIQDTLHLSDQLNLVVGLRHDAIQFALTDRFLSNGDASGSRTLRHTSPIIGLTWQGNSTLSAYFNRATSFETPTTTELAVASGGFNPDLEPQIAVNHEIGLRGEWDGLAPSHWSIALYAIDVDDELIPIEQADGSDLFLNAGKSERRGVELDVHTTLSPTWSAHLAYTLSDFEFEQFTDGNGNVLDGLTTPGTPRHNATLSFDYRHAGRFVTLDVEHTGRIVLNNANSERAPASTRVSVRAGLTRTFDRWQISPFIGVQNLGNERYFSNLRTNAFGGRFYEPAPERSVYGGITVRYALPVGER
ncbi:MAG: TonB-dependent receptor [Pseudomonadota bacterium]